MVVKVLIVDDHHGTVDSHKSILSQNNSGLNFEFTVAYSFQEAETIIKNTQVLDAFDVAILDYELGKKQNPDRKNGKDLGVLIRNKMPEAKIIIITSHTGQILLYNIYEAAQAVGILLKNEYLGNDVATAVETVLKGGTYYTETAKAAISNPYFHNGNLNTLDRKIIELIALGLELATIAAMLKRSIDTIKKRKSEIRELLLVKNKGDQALLVKCRLLNLI